MIELTLPHGLSFEDLYSRPGLERIDTLFTRLVMDIDPVLHSRFLKARTAKESILPKTESTLLLDLAPLLESFIADLFSIHAELAELTVEHHILMPLYTCKRLFIQRQVIKKTTYTNTTDEDGKTLAVELCKLIGTSQLTELNFASAVMTWLSAGEADNESALELARRYANWALYTLAGRARHSNGILFHLIEKTDPQNLVNTDIETTGDIPRLKLAKHRCGRLRQGFGITDPGIDLAGALDEANYCIECHNRDRDSCSKGLFDRESGGFRKNQFGVSLTGCPLEEKISEFLSLKRKGWPIGALAMITVDNPLCAATGHRICNDCMRACIYQKQKPVNIPQAETRTLKDVLKLPWGFEIYSLLTRWNPLNLKYPLPHPPSGYKVLVVGLGPAGFALSHQLLNDGHMVVAIDGLKIEPLPSDISGVTASGDRVPFSAIRNINTLQEDLGDRIVAGFGGVAEYGITGRWDKNFLKIIRLLLERRKEFTMIGGVRFGSTVKIKDAFAVGFDHIALCTGSGRPKVIQMNNGLARGVRIASDFLMSLQLTGASKAGSIANLEIRLPIIVIGGGLTAIDTATEALAYYPLQVEKFLERYSKLVEEQGEIAVRAGWSEEERATADTWLTHARVLRAERAKAIVESRSPNLQVLIQSWGGVTVVYRRRMIDSPSYVLNHEEIAKAFEEGIYFAELLKPKAIEINEYEHACGLVVTKQAITADGCLVSTDEDVILPANTILIAAGTQPNTVLAQEEPDVIKLDGRYFQALNEEGFPVQPEELAKPKVVYVLTASSKSFISNGVNGRFLSYWGDLHPSFSGSVVKAMGGAKQGSSVISRVLTHCLPTEVTSTELLAKINHDLRPIVYRVNQLTPKIVEVVIHAPAAARAFLPGQFYRLQNYEALAYHVDGVVLATEGLAMTGAQADRDKGLISIIALKTGGSSDLCAQLQPGEPVVLMGPTGSPTEIPAGETVVLVAGGSGNAVMFSIGQALRSAGSRVLYFAGYKRICDRYKVEQIEAAADQIVWCCNEAPGFVPSRPGDCAYVGTVVEAMAYYATHTPAIPFSTVDRMLIVGSDTMMAAVKEARHEVLKPYLRPDHLAICSINSPMQCMMKEVCAQCLQPLCDPETGQETTIFSCSNQDQALDRVIFSALRQRLCQNSLQEKLTALWIDRCLRRLGLRETKTRNQL